MTPQEIAALLQEHGGSRDVEDVDEVTKIDDSHQKRTNLLSDVLATCKEAWTSNSIDIEAIAEKLADGSRDVAWRLPYGDSGILEFFLSLLAGNSISQKLHVHCLRLIGNSCADTEANRARVVDQDRLSLITRHIDNKSLIPFNVPVIYNILVDYEPAQLLASQSRLNQQLIALLTLPNLSKYSAFVPFICKILALLISQDEEASVADPSTVAVLLRLANAEDSEADVDDFIGLVGVALAYLASEVFQFNIVQEEGQFGLFMEVFYQAHAGFDKDDIEDEESVAQLKQLCSTLLATLADMSAMDAFPSRYPLSSPVAQSFLAWLRGNNTSLQSAACLALGNLSRSDEASLFLVDSCRAHLPLIELLSNPAVTDTQQLHAAMSFLKNLAIPQSNKNLLADLLLPDCVPRIYSLDTLPQIQFAAISLTRLLLLNCPQNVAIICRPLKSSTVEGSDAKRTSINDIISLFDRSDAEPTRLEAARCIAAVCRMLHSSSVSDILPFTGSSNNNDDESVRSIFYSGHNVDGPLKFLITQEKWPSLRSEAWFVFALMSRSKTGAGVILSVLEDRTAESALSETITGRKLDAEAGHKESIEQSADEDSPKSNEELAQAANGLQLEPQQVDPKQRASMAKVDRENGLIMCTELVKNCESEMGDAKSSRMQRLIQEGTQHVVTARTEALNI